MNNPIELILGAIAQAERIRLCDLRRRDLRDRRKSRATHYAGHDPATGRDIIWSSGALGGAIAQQLSNIQPRPGQIGRGVAAGFDAGSGRTPEIQPRNRALGRDCVVGTWLGESGGGGGGGGEA